MTHPIPDEALDDRLAIVGTAGAGKTYLTIGAMTRLLKRGSRVIGVDALGVMWGLRLRPDGKTPSPYEIVIFGGPHGDLPLNEHAGALIGETVATMRESCILDLSEIGTKAAERRFMLAFLTALYRHANKEPVHLIVDEADMWAPQRLLDKDGEAAKLLGMMETIVRRGRIKGFIPWLVTQRPAVLSKDVLSQADGLVALKLTAKQDHDAVGGWIEATADKGQWQAIKASLATKQRGEGVLWIPARGVLEAVTFPPNDTYDSSRTPKRGEKRPSATLKTIDLGKLKERLATVEADAKANDPRVLKAEIARLTRELAAKPASVTVEKINTEEIERAAYAAAHGVGYREGWEACRAAAKIEFGPMPAIAAPPAVERRAPKPVAAMPRSIDARTVASSSSLPVGERAVLIAAVQYGGVDRDQLSVLTGYKRSSRDTYVSRLREKGLVQVQGQTILPTDAAADVLGADYQPLPTGADLQIYWANKLPEGEGKILGVLIDAYPKSLSKTTLDVMTGYKRSSRDTYIARLKSRRLVTTDGATVRAAETLF